MMNKVSENWRPTVSACGRAHLYMYTQYVI